MTISEFFSPSQVFLKNNTDQDLGYHLANISNSIHVEYPYGGFPEDLSMNDSRACAGFPVYLKIGNYAIIYIDKEHNLNVNNTGRETIRIMSIPDQDFEIEFDFRNCSRREIKMAAEHLKQYQQNKKKRQREV